MSWKKCLLIPTKLFCAWFMEWISYNVNFFYILHELYIFYTIFKIENRSIIIWFIFSDSKIWNDKLWPNSVLHIYNVFFHIVCYSKRFGPRGIGHCGAGGQSIGLTCDLNDETERYLKIPNGFNSYIPTSFFIACIYQFLY